MTKNVLKIIKMIKIIRILAVKDFFAVKKFIPFILVKFKLI